MSLNTAKNILIGPSTILSSGPRAKTLRRYQLSWNPSFYTEESSVYIIGEDVRYSSLRRVSTPSSTFITNTQDLIDLGLTNSFILPLNTNIALAQEYSSHLKNKIVTYETVGGNSITTFGQAIKNIDLRIRIIKLSDAWKVYYQALEAITHLSGNQTRYYGNLYLSGYDSFGKDSLTVAYKYKVSVMSLDFNFKSDSNTTVGADLKFVVTQDLSSRRGKWGLL